jgi:hypothetical protein
VTRKQREALRMLQQHGDPHIGPGGGVVMNEATALFDGQPWLHWRTAEALERSGLAEIDYTWDGPDGNPEITLTEKGLAA